MESFEENELDWHDEAGDGGDDDDDDDDDDDARQDNRGDVDLIWGLWRLPRVCVSAAHFGLLHLLDARQAEQAAYECQTADGCCK